MTLTASQVIFSYLAAASLTSAALAVTRKNPVHSVLWVLALFLHIAGIYLLLGAEFLAAVQVIVYAGAILVFYLFVLMLLNLSEEAARDRFGRHWPLGVVAASAFAVLLWRALASEGPAPDAAAGPMGWAAGPMGWAAGAPWPGSNGEKNLATLGAVLYGPFALPFEVASLVLLTAIVGAVVLAKRRSPS